MTGPKLCLAERFDGAQCVLNADHVNEPSPFNAHGYAYRPVVSEEVWLLTKHVRAMRDSPESVQPTPETLDAAQKALHEAVERMFK